MTTSSSGSKADQAKKDSEPFYCPGCHGPVHLRKGLLKRHHFAHYAAANCEVFSEGETEEHLSAKELLYEWLTDETIEIEAYLPDLQQRTGSSCGQTAIEVQCSALSGGALSNEQRSILPITILLVASRQTSTAATPPSMDRFAKGLLPFCGATGVLFVDHRYTRAKRVGLIYEINWHYKWGVSFVDVIFGKENLSAAAHRTKQLF